MQINQTLKFTVLAIGIMTAATRGAGQAPPSPDQLVAALKQNLADGQKRLRQYEWVETTAISLKGEEKSRKQQRVYYGADGKLTKVPVGEPKPQAAASGGGLGRGRRRAGKGKHHREQERRDGGGHGERLVSCIHQYAPPRSRPDSEGERCEKPVGGCATGWEGASRWRRLRPAERHDVHRCGCEGRAPLSASSGDLSREARGDPPRLMSASARLPTAPATPRRPRQGEGEEHSRRRRKLRAPSACEVGAAELQLNPRLEEVRFADRAKSIERSVSVGGLEPHVVREIPVEHRRQPPELAAGRSPCRRGLRTVAWATSSHAPGPPEKKVFKGET